MAAAATTRKTRRRKTGKTTTTNVSTDSHLYKHAVSCKYYRAE
jgi:hypothetical protein